MRMKATMVLVLFSGVVSAQTIPIEDRFFQAIRRNDLPALQSLVREHGVDEARLVRRGMPGRVGPVAEKQHTSDAARDECCRRDESAACHRRTTLPVPKKRA